MKIAEFFKIHFLLSLVFFLAACSEGMVEEIAFRETLKYQLIEKCGQHEGCKKAVKEKIQECMDLSEWRKFLNNQEDEKEKLRFLVEFYACLKDPNGDPYFEFNI